MENRNCGCEWMRLLTLPGTIVCTCITRTHGRSDGRVYVRRRLGSTREIVAEEWNMLRRRGGIRALKKERGRAREREREREKAVENKKMVRDEGRSFTRARGSGEFTHAECQRLYVAGKRKTSVGYILDFLHYWVTCATDSKQGYLCGEICARTFIRPEWIFMHEYSRIAMFK